MSNWYEDLDFSADAEVIDEKGNLMLVPANVDEGVTNQGYAHSNNRAPIKSCNVYHRTHYEPLFTAACIRREILALPLPLAIYGWQRIEPDYLVIKDGFMVLVELDGLSHLDELASKEQKRLKPFRDNLVHVMRFPVPPDTDIGWAHGILDQVLERIQKLTDIYGGQK